MIKRYLVLRDFYYMQVFYKMGETIEIASRDGQFYVDTNTLEEVYVKNKVKVQANNNLQEAKCKKNK